MGVGERAGTMAIFTVLAGVNVMVPVLLYLVALAGCRAPKAAPLRG